VIIHVECYRAEANGNLVMIGSGYQHAYLPCPVFALYPRSLFRRLHVSGMTLLFPINSPHFFCSFPDWGYTVPSLASTSCKDWHKNPMASGHMCSPWIEFTKSFTLVQSWLLTPVVRDKFGWSMKQSITLRVMQSRRQSWATPPREGTLEQHYPCGPCFLAFTDVNHHRYTPS